MNVVTVALRKRRRFHGNGLAFTVFMGFLGFASFPAAARDTVEDEFNTLADQIQSPPSASWMQHAYSTNSMPIPSDRDPVDVLLRRTATLLGEFNQDGLLDSEAAELAVLAQENASISVTSTAERLALFRKVSAVSRRVAFANPLLKFKDIVFLKRKKSTYNHMVDCYFGFTAVPGGGIYILKDAFSDNPALVDVLQDSVCENGRFMGQKLDFGGFLSPSLSYDGKTLYFCHAEASSGAREWNKHSTFHIFKVNVDGTGLRQLTDGPVNDLFPYPLPNGRIVFVSERRGGYGRCHERECTNYTLYTMNADGTDITLMSAHETNEWQPWVDNDGMVVYTRWDYVDRGADQAHHPWITYPDGRDPRAIHGNWKEYGSASPYMEQDVRSIPDSHKYVATAAPHHGQTFGSFVLIDPRVEDDNRMSPLKILTPEAQFPEATTGSGSDWKFATAWALSERFYLCGYDPAAGTHALTLLDAKTGLKTEIYHDPGFPCTYPIPFVPRPTPPRIPHLAASGRPLEPGQTFDPSAYDGMPTTGEVALMDVYDSTLPFPTNTVIRYLRIMEVLPKTTWDHLVPHIGYAHEDPARRVLGTVPVESDGSAYFTVPADTPVFFQALDENMEAVQSMRSLTYVKPGETLTCAGCHEPRGHAPAMDLQPTAVQRAPSEITPEVEGSNPFSYPQLVQPVLDARCVSCHETQGAMDLSAGGYSGNFNYWYNSYLNLEPFAFYYGDYANSGYDTWNETAVSTPGQVGAKASRLYREILTQDHHGLALTAEELHRITLWLDCNSDFFGAYEDTLEQAQGQTVQPIDPRITGYQTVTNTVYGPAIPAGSTNAINNNHGLSQFGTPLELTAPLIPGSLSEPLVLGRQAVGGLTPAEVDAGRDALAYVNGSPATLSGSVTVDGQPPVPGTVVTWWSLTAGPTNAAIGDTSSLSTTVAFSQPGSYVLRLSATTGVSTNSDDVLIAVLPNNQAPLVDAGPDRMLGDGTTNAVLAGSVLDDSGDANASWSRVSGPDSVVFDAPGSPVCNARFSATGTYVLRLAANDGHASASDDCTVEVLPAGSNNPPQVSSGNDINTSYADNPISLQGSASDDGVPNPLDTTWSVLSGPGSVTFTDASSPATAADFSQFGHYLLQLTATDGDRTAYDQLSVYLYPGDGTKAFGSITREVWEGIGGSSLTDLTGSPDYPDNPTSTGTITSFQAPSNAGSDYGSRVHGYLCPPVSGDYTFWIASDDDSELWLSSNDQPGSASLIASVSGWTNPLQWDKSSSQQSAAITLQAGQVYYIRALQKEGGGGDHLAVAWEGPGIARAVIPGAYLASYGGEGSFVPPSSGGPVVLDSNHPPSVDAGTDQAIGFNESGAALRGRASDDGLPASPGSLSLQWSVAGGPGSVTFSNAASAFTYASFSAPGQYLLRFEASDGERSDSDTVVVTVEDNLEYDFFYPSPQEVAFSPDGSTIAAADAGLNRVVLIDRATRQVIHTVSVNGSPRGMAWEGNDALWVCEYDAGSLAKVTVSKGKVTRRMAVGVKPYDVELDAGRNRLVATDYGQSKVCILDLATGQIAAEIPVVEKPMYLALTPNRQLAVVANSEPKGDARDIDYAAAVSVIDLETHGTTEIRLPPGSTSLRDIAASPDGNWAYVAHLLGRTYLPTSQLNNGWILNNVVSIIDLASGEVYATVPLDALEEGAANPWGMAVSGDGQTLWVCGSGIHELIEMDLAAIHSHLAEDPQHVETIEYDLISLYENGWIERHLLKGKGPRGVSLSPDGKTLAVATYFSGEVHLLDTVSGHVDDAVATGMAVPEHALRRGERLYFDGDGCFQRWLSCSSCHPFARDDGLNWDLLNDGIGNPKNTKSHLYSTETPASMWTGVRASVDVAIQAGFKYIQFQQRSDQEMQDVFDYLSSLRPEASPKLNKSWLTPAAMRGKAIFNDPAVGCANCHSGTHFTNMRTYDVGTGHPADVGSHDPIYDTPILRELWRSAPYLHDGSAASLRDVVTTQNPGDSHGSTTHLSSAEIDDLVAYLEQIGGDEDWVNGAPIVDAGQNQVLTLPATTAQLAAMAQDEGLPNGTLTLTWAVQSGPAPVVFEATNAPDTTATFTVAGDYVLACSADDGDLTASDTLLVAVRPEGSATDTDSDGMGDAWETHYFSGLGAVNGGASDDWDEDGLNNLHEYLAGTDPTDKDSGFRIEIAMVDEQLVVRFTAHAAGTALTPGNRYFTLQGGTMVDGELVWSDLEGYVDLLGTGQPVEWNGPGPEPTRLFRVRVRLTE